MVNLERVEQLRKRVLTGPVLGNAVGFFFDKIGDIRNKVVLDSGCGKGEMSVLLAFQGAKVIGLDASKPAINDSRSLAQSFGVENHCSFIQAQSESIPIQSESVDIIFSKSTIQYMDREKVLDEYTRIIKPDGIVVLIENLPYNPFINLYRFHRKVISSVKRTTRYLDSVRGYITPNEIETFANRFLRSEHNEYHLFCMISYNLRRHSKHNRFMMKAGVLFSNLDKQLLSLFPFLKRLAWITALYCEGKRTGETPLSNKYKHPDNVRVTPVRHG
jgi:2-polyprenyl-3-methyl-5-hydroxy-6-metoxy-1,4-benzoquinol methylase